VAPAVINGDALKPALLVRAIAVWLAIVEGLLVADRTTDDGTGSATDYGTAQPAAGTTDYGTANGSGRAIFLSQLGGTASQKGAYCQDGNEHEFLHLFAPIWAMHAQTNWACMAVADEGPGVWIGVSDLAWGFFSGWNCRSAESP